MKPSTAAEVDADDGARSSRRAPAPPVQLGGISVAGKTGTAQIGANGSNLTQPAFVGVRAGRPPEGRDRGDGRRRPTAASAARSRLRSRKPCSRPCSRTVGDGRSSTPGTIVDSRYKIVSRLGAGGMADVFLAEDEQLGRKVALKLLYQRFAEDPGFVERFRREAQAAAGLQHPNVVSVYDRGSLRRTRTTSRWSTCRGARSSS